MGGAGGGGAETSLQYRGRREAQGAVTGSTEGCRAEAGEAEEGAPGSGGRRSGKDGAEGWDHPCAAGVVAAESERAGANEVDERGAGAAEGSGSDVGKGFTGAARAGERGAGGGKGAADPGAGYGDTIVG